MVLKAVLFDHDGTLVDSEPIHHQFWLQALAPYNVSLSLSDYLARYIGVPTLDNAADLIQRFQLPVSVEKLAVAKIACGRQYLMQQPFPLMPAARETLATLKAQGLQLAIVTGTTHTLIEASLQQHHLTDYFQTVVCADDVVHNKPAPDVYLLAMQRLGLSAADCIALEDSEHGFCSARAAGLDCLVIAHPYSKPSDFPQAAAYLPSLTAAREWIEHQLEP